MLLIFHISLFKLKPTFKHFTLNIKLLKKAIVKQISLIIYQISMFNNYYSKIT
jgi:hypothetical protein